MIGSAMPSNQCYGGGIFLKRWLIYRINEVIGSCGFFSTSQMSLTVTDIIIIRCSQHWDPAHAPLGLSINLILPIRFEPILASQCSKYLGWNIIEPSWTFNLPPVSINTFSSHPLFSCTKRQSGLWHISFPLRTTQLSHLSLAPQIAVFHVKFNTLNWLAIISAVH